MPGPRRLVRNMRLLLHSGIQHLVDDPALLAVQVSRRLPFSARVRSGKVLHAIGAHAPGDGLAALGAFMAGDSSGAESLIADRHAVTSRLRGEVAVLLDRTDLISHDAHATTRARAAWMRGDLSGAVGILESAGHGGSRYGARLRSELQLLRPGYRLPVQSVRVAGASDEPADAATRVLHLITNSLPHTQSGYSLRTHRILTALREQGIVSEALTRTGYPVMVGRLGAADVDTVDGIRYHRTLPRRLGATPEARLLQEVQRALDIIEDFRPHVIHATTDYRNALVARAVSEATGIPWVLEVRGLMEQTWIASHRTAQARRAAAGSEKARRVAAREAELASEAQGIATLSATMADELVSRGVGSSHITLVPNGVDTGLLSDHLVPQEARERLGIGLPDAFMVGAVSALVDYEGLDILLRAVAHLVHGSETSAELRERLHVVTAGDGASAPGLAALAKELDISKRLLMPGRVRRSDARHWVQALDVVTVPRLDREVSRAVTPQKPVEAMALARPLIISDLPALREVCTRRDGVECALTTPAEDPGALAGAIAALHADPKGAQVLIDSGLEAAAERTWQAIVRQYETLYSAAAARHQEVSARG